MTIGDVAEALGVSKTTVSRAISGKGRIGTATRDRVLAYINEHNFTPNAIAKGLAQQRTYNLGWVIPGDYDTVDLPFFQNCLLGISETASSLQYDILVSMVKGHDISQLERAVTNHKIDGVILSRTLENDRPAQYLLEQEIPFVAIGNSRMPGVIRIDHDHQGACKELTALLLLKGIRKIGLIGGNRSFIVTQSRLAGFMAAFAEVGLDEASDMIYLDVDHAALVDRVVSELLDKGAECIVCMDDSLCREALRSLKKRQLRIPEDVKVASFYNSPALEGHVPAVTALNFDAVALGRAACRNLIHMIEGEEYEEQILLGYDIVLKESTTKRA